MKTNLPAEPEITDEELKQTIQKLSRLTKLIPPKKEKDEDKLLNFNETANYLGLSHSYLYKLTARKMIPCYKPMGRLYFFRNELDDWIINNENDLIEIKTDPSEKENELIDDNDPP